MTDQERSLSRGREAYHSSGRGGLGNIRQTSASRDRAAVDGPDDFSRTRGREPAVPEHGVYSTGRGGAGNIRSPSRSTPSGATDAREAEILKSHAEADKDAIHSTGRGGFGNMSRSRSRGPSAHPPVHSTGRGGAGNMFPGEASPSLTEAEEAERRQLGFANKDGVHSTGRGGVANIASSPAPGVERHAHTPGAYESSGRGGAGNIRERSVDDRKDAGAEAHKEKHGIAGVFEKLHHGHKHDHEHGETAKRPETEVSGAGLDAGGLRGGLM
ncbi:hypothetical protein HGRIS_000675 [Hohenbuehelia grisea]|uniref:Uncharacterized protein n=1 Tax=Hohenbuehelia grisea TaxID=104357 RepID=A0ABR3JRQ8_9AGAR